MLLQIVSILLSANNLYNKLIYRKQYKIQYDSLDQWCQQVANEAIETASTMLSSYRLKGTVTLPLQVNLVFNVTVIHAGGPGSNTFRYAFHFGTDGLFIFAGPESNRTVSVPTSPSYSMRVSVFCI